MIYEQSCVLPMYSLSADMKSRYLSDMFEALMKQLRDEKVIFEYAICFEYKEEPYSTGYLKCKYIARLISITKNIQMIDLTTPTLIMNKKMSFWQRLKYLFTGRSK